MPLFEAPVAAVVVAYVDRAMDARGVKVVFVFVFRSQLC